MNDERSRVLCSAGRVLNDARIVALVVRAHGSDA